MAETATERPLGHGSAIEVLGAFLWLGVTSFGGPVAHLGYFRTEFVEKRRWLDEAGYADIVALCQVLPGPSSSQVGIAVGALRAGIGGALAAWAGFTLPSAAVMILFAYGITRFGDLGGAPWLHGLKIVAVAVVAQAVAAMARQLAPDRARASLAVAAAVMVLAVPGSGGQIAAIALGGIVGWWFFPRETRGESKRPPLRLDPRFAVAAIGLFLLLLVGLPLAAIATGNHAVALVDRFFRAGALVFGGGHVVLPLLQVAVVPPGWVDNDSFLAGYGAAQAVPGPLFSFAAYLGTVMDPSPHGWAGGLLSLFAIYLPSFLLLLAVLPFWARLRASASVQAALAGVNAAVVGLLLAALYRPVWTSGILAPADFAVAIVAFVLLVFWRTPPWAVVAFGAASAEVMALLA